MRGFAGSGAGALIAVRVWIALTLVPGAVSGVSESGVPVDGPIVLVSFRQAAPLADGTRLMLHVEMPTGQRFAFSFRALSEPEKKAAIAAGDAARVRARREGPAAPAGSVSPGTPAGPPAPGTRAAPAGPAAGSDHRAGSDHAGSGSAGDAAGTAPAPALATAPTRHLGTRKVAVAVLPAVFTGEMLGPAFAATVALHGCPQGDHYQTAPGRCPTHDRPLVAAAAPAFEGAVSLEAGETLVNTHLTFP